MKYSLIAAFVAIALICQAQPKERNNHLKRLKSIVFTPNGVKQPAKYKRGNEYDHKIDSVQKFTYDSLANEYVYTNTEVYTYTNDNKTVEQFFSYPQSNFVYYKSIYTYNSEGFLTKNEDVQWNDTTSSFETNYTISYSYNTDNLIESVNYSNIQYGNTSLDSFLYDDKQRLIEEYYSYTSPTSPEENYEDKVAVTWGMDGRIDFYEVFEKSGQDYELVYFTDVAFNSVENQYEFLSAEEFVPVVGTPIFVERWVSELTDWGITEIDSYYYRETTTSPWVLTEVDSSRFDADQNQIYRSTSYDEGEGFQIQYYYHYQHDNSLATEKTLIPEQDYYYSLDFEYLPQHVLSEKEYFQLTTLGLYRTLEKYFYSSFETSITENTFKTLSVCPNPVTQTLFWELDNYQEVSIFSLQGKLVQYEPAAKGEVDVSKLESGTYILHAVNGEDVYSTRFIKE